uniref:OVATE domain-containing protein n=1 Tax=Triticum aestivum TaxID=4565 RepID=A0A3B6ISU6_WHEAT
MTTSSRSSHHPSCMTRRLLTPCKRALARLFRIPASAALSIRAFRFRNLRKSTAKMSPRHRRRAGRGFRSVRAVFWPLIPPSSTPATSTESHTTRRTPAYVKMVARLRSRTTARIGEEKEEACRSFESCLMEILTEEDKARDLQDVEELLPCWERLKSPVFVDLVCRFYGDLCKDLFSSAAWGEDGGNTDRDVGPVSMSAALLV